MAINNDNDDNDDDGKQSKAKQEYNKQPRLLIASVPYVQLLRFGSVSESEIQNSKSQIRISNHEESNNNEVANE